LEANRYQQQKDINTTSTDIKLQKSTTTKNKKLSKIINNQQLRKINTGQEFRMEVEPSMS